MLKENTDTNENGKWPVYVAHLSAFLWFLLGVFAVAVPLALLFWKGNESPYIKHHLREALNVQLNLLIYSFAVLLFLIFFFFTTASTIGILGLMVFMMMPYVFVAAMSLLAIVAIKDGKQFRYPFTLSLVRWISKPAQ